MKPERIFGLRRLLPRLAWLLVFGVLSACAPPLQPSLTETGAPAASAGPLIVQLTLPPTWTPAPALTQAPSPTARSSQTPLPAYETATPRPTLTLAPPPPVILEPQEFITAAEPLQGVILFTSTYGNPFAEFFSRLPGLNTSTYRQPQLWAISPDGQRAGRLTGPGLEGSQASDEEQGALLYQPPAPGSTPLLLTSASLALDTPLLQIFSLPAECTYPSELPPEMASEWLPCRKFQFSPDGSWLAMAWQAEICGSGLLLLDTQSGEVLYKSTGGMHWFQFLDDQRLLLQTGHCEGGVVSVLDIASAELRALGSAGKLRWNADQSAFVVNASQYRGPNQAVWAYDAAADRLFRPEPKIWGFESRAFWTPDGDAVIFEHRQIIYDFIASELVFSGTMQLVRVDRQSGEQTILAADPAYDYHLCSGWDSNCIQPSGDWVEVLRFPFEPVSLSFSGENLYDYERVNCLLAGTKCEQEAERLALNLVSGEMLHWEEVPLSETTPEAATGQPQTNAPDLTQPPLYSDPDGEYDLYLGLDGHSLWMQPRDPALPAVLWVQQGQDFIYIP